MADAPLHPELEALATLLEYPGDGWRARAEEALLHLPERLGTFRRWVGERDDGELEEAYARTFDWVPARSLDLGWHLYGEQYDRGRFLVRLRERLRAARVDEGEELPDHLGTVLRLLARLPAAEAEALVKESVAPALAKLRGGFEVPDDPYACVLLAVEEALSPVTP